MRSNDKWASEGDDYFLLNSFGLKHRRKPRRPWQATLGDYVFIRGETWILCGCDRERKVIWVARGPRTKQLRGNALLAAGLFFAPKDS